MTDLLLEMLPLVIVQMRTVFSVSLTDLVLVQQSFHSLEYAKNRNSKVHIFVALHLNS